MVVNEHGDGTNILIEELDDCARLDSGGNSLFSMIHGIDSDACGVFYFGYRTWGGPQEAVLVYT